MADVADHTLELLRKLREEHAQGLTEVKGAIQDLTAAARIVNGHIVALVNHEQFAIEKFAEHEARLMRIEKRLNLVDPNNPD